MTTDRLTPAAPRRTSAVAIALVTLAVTVATVAAVGAVSSTAPSGAWRPRHAPTVAPLWSNNPPTLRAVHGARGAAGVWRGWAAGDDAALVRFDGNTWARVPFAPSGAPPGDLTYDIRDVYAVADDDVWAVGHVLGDRICSECGFVAHYDGAGWRYLDPNTELHVVGRVAPLNAIDMLVGQDGKLYGWAVGDDASFDNIKAIILRYKDGGWRLWSGPNNISKNLNAVRIMSPIEAWAVGEGGAESWYLESRDGVGGWPRLGASGVDNLFALDLADTLFGWDGGAGGRMNNYTGSCHDDTLATQCWFDNKARPIRDAADHVLNVDVYGIDLLSRQAGWLVGAAVSRRSLVAYYDHPFWRAVDVESDPGASLYALHMVDPGRGFAVGADGVILEYTDPSFVPSPTPEPDTATPTITASPSTTPTQEPSGTPTSSPTSTEVTPGSATPSSTLETATSTPTASEQASVTVTPSQTPTASPTRSPTPRLTRWLIYAPIVLAQRH